MARFGWYALPKSGTPYYGPIPDGADELADHDITEAIVSSTSPVEVDPDLVLAGSVDEVIEHAESYPIEVVRRLIESEHAGQNRTTLLAKLEKLSKDMEEIPPAG